MESMTEETKQRWAWLQTTARLEALTNAELAGLLEEFLWAVQPELCDLMVEVGERLKQHPETTNAPAVANASPDEGADVDDKRSPKSGEHSAQDEYSRNEG